MCESLSITNVFDGQCQIRNYILGSSRDNKTYNCVLSVRIQAELHIFVVSLIILWKISGNSLKLTTSISIYTVTYSPFMSSVSSHLTQVIEESDID